MGCLSTINHHPWTCNATHKPGICLPHKMWSISRVFATTCTHPLAKCNVSPQL